MSASSFQNTPVGPARRFARGLWRWTRRLLILGVVAGVLAVSAGVGAYLYFDRDLPSVEQLKSYRPPQVTKVICADGSVCAEFYRERRTWVDVRDLPPHVKNAFLAAEDADFYKHEGLDYFGMARALVRGVQRGRFAGASTITQQACRNLLLTRERKLSRKIREWILTPRMEKALTKDEILNLYLNQIYFGHNRYGIEEAALFYFGKSAKDLSIAEAAVLGGTPQLPHLINPLTNVVRAKKRQQYVLRQLAERGFLPRQVTEAELDKPIVLAPRPPPQVGPYYVEEVRRALIARYGEDAVLEGGLRVEIAMLPALQRAADEALERGLEAVDRRMGYSGPLARLEPDRFAAMRPHLATRLEEAGRRKDEVLVADLTRLVGLAKAEPPAAPPPEVTLAAALEETLEREAEVLPTPGEMVAREVSLRTLREGLRAVGYVSRVDDAGKFADVDLVGQKARIPFSQVTWARPRAVGKSTPAPKQMSEVLAVGDLVRVRLGKPGKTADAPLEATLDQVPEVQGAFVAIDPQTRRVVALSGGYDFELSSFNRATQARRQPGSAFKPFVYGAALDTGSYTPITVMNDAPEVFLDRWSGQKWAPQNYDGRFSGPMTLRAAVAVSKNTIPVRLVDVLTPATVIDFARRCGVRSKLPEFLPLALGAGEVGVLELTNAYATLHSHGRYAEPVLVLRVTNAEGTVLEAHEAVFEETLRPSTAFLVTSLLQSVVEDGTAKLVQELGRPAAGKTGTTNDENDAWFVGYTRDYVGAAWVGFDAKKGMGKGEAGGRSALPVWLDFMKVAHRDLPLREFDPPPGIEFVRIDPLSGLLAGSAVPGRLEPFLQGTAPTVEAPSPETVRPEDFFLHDSRSGL
jgi:penicillin-binding protein 1A